MTTEEHVRYEQAKTLALEFVPGGFTSADNFARALVRSGREVSDAAYFDHQTGRL
jgi:hypothetical protein